jgi:hypothetical protein
MCGGWPKWKAEPAYRRNAAAGKMPDGAHIVPAGEGSHDTTLEDAGSVPLM